MNYYNNTNQISFCIHISNVTVSVSAVLSDIVPRENSFEVALCMKPSYLKNLY